MMVLELLGRWPTPRERIYICRSTEIDAIVQLDALTAEKSLKYPLHLLRAIDRPPHFLKLPLCDGLPALRRPRTTIEAVEHVADLWNAEARVLSELNEAERRDDLRRVDASAGDAARLLE